MVAVVAHSVAVVASAATAVVTALSHVAHLALKATVAVTASKAVAIVLKTVVHPHRALKLALRAEAKVAAISVQKAASNPAVISAANNAALHLAVAKAVSSPVAISVKMHVLRIEVATVLNHVTIATAVPRAHLAVVTMLAAVQAIVSQGALKWSVLATSSPTMQVATQHPSALALKC